MPRKRPLAPDRFKEVYSVVPRLTVDLLIETNEGYLLTLRKKDSYINQWHMPGGSVFYRERVGETIKRVSLEELGLEAIVDRQIGYLEYFSEEQERGFGYSVALIFLCRLPRGAKIVLDDGVSEYGFFKSIPNNIVKEQGEFISRQEVKTIL